MDFTTLWTSDFLAGTHPLTPEQRGVYITLICHFNNKDRVVPDDDRHLARICNMGARRYRTVKQELIDGDFISTRDGYLWIERSSVQWKKDAKFSNSQRAKAEKKQRIMQAKALDDCASESENDAKTTRKRAVFDEINNPLFSTSGLKQNETRSAGAGATPSPSLKKERRALTRPIVTVLRGG